MPTRGSKGGFSVGSLQLPDATLRSTTLLITNAQAKALRATPLTIVPAAGAGFTIVPLSATIKLNYGGTNAFTAAINDNFGLKWKDGTTASIMTGGVQGFVQATATSVSRFVEAVAAGSTINVTSANSSNQPLVIHNITASEIAGNAGNDNTFTVKLVYAVVSL